MELEPNLTNNGQRADMSASILEQFELLGQLKLIDEKLYRLSLELRKIPEEEQKLDSDLAKEKAQYDEIKNNFDSKVKLLREAELNLKTQESDLEKAETKLMEAKSNEAYQAGQKELESQRGNKGGLEETILELMTSVDSLKGEVKEAEEKFKSFEKTVLASKSELTKDTEKINASVKDCGSQKEELAQKLPEKLKTVYTRLSRADGVAIAYAENGTCEGCNMKILPQIYNQILGAEIVTPCPACHKKILIKKSE